MTPQTTERQNLISELILAGATSETIELARDALIEDIQCALSLQKAITFTASYQTEDSISRQLATRSRK